MALYNPASGAWTDMIWAGGNLLGEVTGSQAPEYRLLDHEGSLVATTDSSGGVTGTDMLTPYGQAVSNSTSDFYLYTGLDQDAINGSDHAWYRNYSTAQSRWLRPDPYNGSYDLYNPQSFNRYNYVENNPLTFVDPSGEAGGWANGVGGSVCKVFGKGFQLGNPEGTINGFNPCNPVASVVAFGLSPLLSPMMDGIDQGLNTAFNTNYFNTNVGAGDIVPYIAAAITIACSIDNSKAACGPSGLASLIPGFGGDLGRGVGDGIAVASAVSCSMGGLSNPVCVGFVVYDITDSLYSFFNNLFNGAPQFTGSLVPRPADLSGLGTSKIGIPNQNLSINDILGQSSQGTLQSPGMRLP